MIFAVLDPSPSTVCINCSFFYIYRRITPNEEALRPLCPLSILHRQHVSLMSIVSAAYNVINNLYRLQLVGWPFSRHRNDNVRSNCTPNGNTSAVHFFLFAEYNCSRKLVETDYCISPFYVATVLHHNYKCNAWTCAKEKLLTFSINMQKKDRVLVKEWVAQGMWALWIQSSTYGIITVLKLLLLLLLLLSL